MGNGFLPGRNESVALRIEAGVGQAQEKGDGGKGYGQREQYVLREGEEGAGCLGAKGGPERLKGERTAQGRWKVREPVPLPQENLWEGCLATAVTYL